MNSFPRVLISAPQAKAKAYCFERFIDNVMQFKYPNFDVKLFDNTLDDGEFTSYMNSYVIKNHGKNARFEALNTCLMHKMTSDSVIERMARSHNDCRDFTLRLKYDYLLHLETDLFPPHDVIEQLMSQTKPIISALYYVDNGIYRKPMIQRTIKLAPKFITSKNFMANEDLCFCDGTIKKIAHAGLGCILIHRSVLEKVKFRSIQGLNNHPDTYFAEDCAKHKIPIYLDSSIVVEHQNSPWGVFGLDYK
jgi:hemerythrin-like domain-containing protein